MEDRIEAVRRFNRFYMHQIGVIDARFPGCDMSSSEAGLLFEIAQRTPVHVATLQDVMHMDRDCLCRLITQFERENLISTDQSEQDRYACLIRITEQGRFRLARVDAQIRKAVRDSLAGISPSEQQDLVRALSHARRLLAPQSEASFTLRAARPGEPSLIAARQSALYAESHGWGHDLECLIADSVATFLRHFKPEREGCWIAELDGVMAGGVFLTDEGNGAARLRLLHVEPFARRRGIGDALVQHCLSFARAHHYERAVLWTNAILEPARRLYARNGFTCIASAIHTRFGTPVLGEDWECPLSSQSTAAAAKNRTPE